MITKMMTFLPFSSCCMRLYLSMDKESKEGDGKKSWGTSLFANVFPLGSSQSKALNQRCEAPSYSPFGAQP
jgi:hypothetical protein